MKPPFKFLAVSSGSFVHDASLSFSDGEWTPTKEELVVMGAAMHKLAEKAIPIERLEVGRQVHCASSPQSRCFVFDGKFWLPMWLHSSCSISPLAGRTCQKLLTKSQD